MKLIESNFTNFRCFVTYELKYGAETTVIIGKNGTGKSSVLSGIRRGLSFMFAKSKGFKKNLATSNNATVKSFKELEANFDSIGRNYNYPINNHFKAEFNTHKLDWSLVKNNMSAGLLTSRYSDALQLILDYYNNSENPNLPVLSVITDSFPHQSINSGSKAKKIINLDVIPRDFGYYGWDERTSCIDLWLNRFYKVSNFNNDLKNDIRLLEEQIFLFEKLIDNRDDQDKHKVPEWEEKIDELKNRLEYLQSDKRDKSFSKEREFIQNKLIEFTKPLTKEYEFINAEFELFHVAVSRTNKKNNSIEFFFKDGRIISFETLPMGYKRVFSIVFDIAYRSFILNENNNSEGIILIDEIELHLHPTLQQEILQRLNKTFPKIQFIVTTHSPLVISNFKSDENNKIIKLENDGNKYSNKTVEDIYGIDYATNLTEIMEVSPRSSTIDKYINGFLFLRRKGKITEASKLLDKLQEYLGGTIPPLLENEIKKKTNQL